MYESFFGLTRRPFSATPDPDCCAGVETMQNAFDQLCGFVEQGEGIAILSAPAGMGKTLLCQRFATECQQDFRVALLANGNFESRRSLLQAVLYELGRPYTGMDEQELRLEMTSVVNAAVRKTKGVFLILDEAHLAAQCVLDEIRSMTNLTRQATPLVRVLLSAQLQFEETITAPEFDAFNQRVRAHATLEPISRKESIEYIEFRLAWAGAEMKRIFTPDAASLIVQVSDGVPRCINQLCDHSMFIAFAGGERPIGKATVEQALDDLKRLPLQWHLPESMFEETKSTPVNRDAATKPASTKFQTTAASSTAAHAEAEFSIEIGDGLAFEEFETKSSATLEIGGQPGESAVIEIGGPEIAKPDLKPAQILAEPPRPATPAPSKPEPKSAIADSNAVAPVMTECVVETSAAAGKTVSSAPRPAPKSEPRSSRREGRAKPTRQDFWTNFEAPSFAEEKIHVLATTRDAGVRTAPNAAPANDEVVTDRYAAIDEATFLAKTAAAKSAKSKRPETKPGTEVDAKAGLKSASASSRVAKPSNEPQAAQKADIIQSVEEEIVSLVRETSAITRGESADDLDDELNELTVERLRRVRQSQNRVELPEYDVILPVDDAGISGQSAGKRSDGKSQAMYAKLFTELRNRRSG